MYTITRINGMLRWANFVQSDANKGILDSFNGAWHTKHIGTTFKIIFEAIVEWDDIFILHDNIYSIWFPVEFILPSGLTSLSLTSLSGHSTIQVFLVPSRCGMMW